MLYLTRKIYHASHGSYIYANHNAYNYLHSRANNKNKEVGKITIPSSTFIGSPRNMVQKYQYSMTIAYNYWKPDFFYNYDV